MTQHVITTNQPPPNEHVYYYQGNLFYTDDKNGTGTRVVSFSTVNGHSHTLPIYFTRGYVPLAVSFEGIILRCGGGGYVTTTTSSGHPHRLRLEDGTGDWRLDGLFIGSDNSFYSTKRATYVQTYLGLNLHYHQAPVPEHSLVYGISEDTSSPTINIYVDNGSGYGDAIGPYTTNQSGLDLKSHFSGTGAKRVKLTTTENCRIIYDLTLGADITD